jgi:hypothetical protein
MTLEKEILKYQKKGFKVAQKRTLKFGSRIFLRKEKFLGFYGIYLYYADGDCTMDSLRECFKDYTKFYYEQGFGEGDKGFYLCSGSLDERLFKDLRKAMISEDIRSSIKAVSLGEVIIERAVGKEIPKKIIEKAPERRIKRQGARIERISLEKVLNVIKSTPFVPQPKEKGYEAQLYAVLHSQGFPVEYESQRKGARFDLVVGRDEIAVELKVVKSSSVFDALYGQVARYRDQFNKVIIVLVDQFRNPSVMNNEIDRLKKISSGNIEVIVK